MAKKNWIYAINPFMNATINSYRTTLIISQFHFSALDAAKTNPFFLDLFNKYSLVHQSFIDTYTVWDVQGNSQISNTLNLTQLLKALVKNIRNWDIKIQNVYEISTPAYKALMPSGRGVFQNGAQLNRLTALQVLVNNLSNDNNLNDLAAEVTAFNTLIHTAYTNQKMAKVGTKQNSIKVEAQRIAVCTAQYTHLGLLMAHFATEPVKVERFFDMERIRKNAQCLFTKHIKPNTTIFIAKRTLQADDVIEFTNTGNTSISFYMAQNKKAAMGEIFITVEAGETKNITAKELSTIANAHYLLAKNNDEISFGSYEVYLG